MNENEALDVVTFIATPYNRVVDPSLVGVWYQAALQRIDVPEAMDVAVELLNVEEFMPTPAKFNECRGRQQREEYLAEREVKAQEEGRLLDPGAAMPDRVRQAIADLRASFASANDTRGHWHGGPDACPVCGGINPDVLARLPQQDRDRILTIQAQRRARRHADQGGMT